MRRKSLIFSILLMSLIGISVWFWPSPSSFQDVKASYRPSDVWVTDQHGHPMEIIRLAKTQRSLGWARLSEVSPLFLEQLIRAEDQRFYQHRGIDVWSLGKVIFEALQGSKVRGASTISMQVASLLEKKNGNVFLRKIDQILMALALERSWSKSQILEAYLNFLPFRGELVGLRVASMGYFQKHPISLSDQESALLVALIRAPNASPDKVASRACGLLHRSQPQDCAGIQQQAREIFEKPYFVPRERSLISVLSSKILLPSTDPSLVLTSLDFTVQNLAVQALREQLQELRNKNVKDGAVLVIENETGRVVAYVSNGGIAHSSAHQIDGILARRQAGSTLKPFIYATALERGLIRPNSLLEDSPADITVAFGKVYRPNNYDNQFRGLVMAGEALGSSLNVPAVRLLQLVGENHAMDSLEKLGLTELQSEEFYGPSLALGTVDVNLWELTRAYRNLAAEKEIFSNQTREEIFAMLSSNENRRFTFGLQSLFALPFSAAVKTGTSKDMRDNWCLGYTSKYTVGVWIGNFDGEPMWNVSGLSGAAPIWVRMMKGLHPSAQGSLTTHPQAGEILPIKTITRIRYPAKDMLVGLDPDIPRALQKLPIEIESPQTGHSVYLNGKLFSKSEETIFWAIQSRGQQRIELKDQNGRVVDQVRFIVR